MDPLMINPRAYATALGRASICRPIRVCRVDSLCLSHTQDRRRGRRGHRGRGTSSRGLTQP